MSDSAKNDTDPEKEAGKDESPASVAGKGWDILVGGKDNSAAAGGSDPFDMNKTAPSATTADLRAKDSETDAILDDGLLFIKMAKSPQAKAHKIAVNAQ